MSRLVDNLIAYRILNMLVTPFDKTDAFRLGIIDSRGKELKRISELNTADEMNAYSFLHRLVFRLKKIIEKVPIENKKLASYAAAYALIRESLKTSKEPINLETMFFEKLKTNLNEEISEINKYLESKKMLTFAQFSEEAPANSSGGPGAPAGLPGDESGTVVVKRKKLLRRKPWV